MPEDWRTLVDANLYSISTNMVPEVRIPFTDNAASIHCKS